MSDAEIEPSGGRGVAASGEASAAAAGDHPGGERLEREPVANGAHLADGWRLGGTELRRRRIPGLAVWSILRTSLGLVLRRKLVWLFLALGAINYLFYSALVYLLADLQSEFRDRGMFAKMLKQAQGFSFEGDGASFREFIFAQNIVVVLLLGFAGSVLIGNDFRHRSVAFYLSKPISRLQYFLGKLLAVFTLAASLTLLPALLLFVQYGVLTDSLDYFSRHSRVLVGILVYGGLVSLTVASGLLGLGALVRKPIAMTTAWLVVTVFPAIVAGGLREALQRRTGSDPWEYSLVDPFAILRWISGMVFGIGVERYEERMVYAIPVLVVVLVVSTVLFWRVLRRVEVVK